MAGSSQYSGTLSITNFTDDALVRKMDEMGRQLEALKMKSKCPYEKDFNTTLPFTSKIMKEAIPPRFKMPHTELYDGFADPLDHLEAFKALMLLHRANDGTLNRAFPATLRKAAREWFFNLPPKSIGLFEQLR